MSNNNGVRIQNEVDSKGLHPDWATCCAGYTSSVSAVFAINAVKRIEPLILILRSVDRKQLLTGSGIEIIPIRSENRSKINK